MEICYTCTNSKGFPEITTKKEDVVFISGLVVQVDFYHMDTFDYTIRRAPTIASGLKVANPDLSV